MKTSKTKYKELMQKELDELKQLLNDLPVPNLNEETDEPAFIAEKHKERGEMKAVDVKLEEVDV